MDSEGFAQLSRNMEEMRAAFTAQLNTALDAHHRTNTLERQAQEAQSRAAIAAEELTKVRHKLKNAGNEVLYPRHE